MLQLWIYSLLNASIGLRLAACTDGKNPKITPIAMENRTLRMMAGILIATGVPAAREMTSANMMPEITPRDLSGQQLL